MTDPKRRDPKEVAQMFSRVAPKYDLINRAMCFGLDLRWRKILADELLENAPNTKEAKFLDLACGSGDVCIAIAKRAPNAEIVGVDFCKDMLARAREKAGRLNPAKAPIFIESDCSALPFQGETFDGVSVAFGFRNFEDRQKCLKEAARVLKPGGKFAMLEVAKAEGIFSMPQRIFMSKAVPLVARLLGGTKCDYQYLAATTLAYPANAEIREMFGAAGFRDFKRISLAFGMVAISSGVKK